MQPTETRKQVGEALFAEGSTRQGRGRQGGQDRGGTRSGCHGNRDGHDGGCAGNNIGGGGSRANPESANASSQPNLSPPTKSLSGQCVFAVSGPVTSGGTVELG